MPNTQLDVRGMDYSKIILPLARQEKSMLYGTVYNKTGIVGKSFFQDQIGNWEMTEKIGPNAATPQNDPNLSRTRVDIKTYTDARIFDRSLMLQEFADPMSVNSIGMQSAVGVQLDKVIYGAMGGNALRGETGGTVVAFPSTQKVAVDLEVASTNTGLTVAKIRRAGALLDAAGVPMTERFFVGSAKGKEYLLGSTIATSSDYNNVKALVAGDINSFYGFQFKWLPDGIITKTGDVAEYFAYHKTGVCVGMLEELFMRVDELPDYSYSKQVFYEINVGAGRLEEKKVVKILADESKVLN